MGTKRGPIVESAQCRCCGETKKCRLLNIQYEHMNRKEVYVDMIIDCFGLVLSNMDSEELDRCVCATCVVRIRDSYMFREQILKCEEMFLKRIHQDAKVSNEQESSYKMEIKSEKPRSVVDESDHDYDDVLDVYSPVLDDPEKETHKRRKSETKTRDIKQKSKKQVLDKNNVKHLKMKSDLLKNMLEMKILVDNTQSVKPKKRQRTQPTEDHLKLLPEHSALLQAPTTIVPNGSELISHVSEKIVDDDVKMYDNTITIVKYSYVCPFRTRISHYICYYCRRVFTDPLELREHNLTHNQLLFPRIYDRQMLKIDTTKIDCRLCHEKIDDLDAFKIHVRSVHKKRIHDTNAPEVIKFKLNAIGDCECAECGKKFQFIDKLIKHLSEHFGKYVCDLCGARFIIEPSLFHHIRKHNTKRNETYPCEICGKNFKSNYSRILHVATVHEKRPVVPCIKCDASFLSHAQRNRHLINVHGDRRQFKCKDCERVFDVRKSLMEHIRKNHASGFRHQCDVCEQQFVSPRRLLEHKAMHTGDRNFRCSYCDKSYPRRKSLADHIRTHKNDYRYKCNMCESSFTQNVRLRNHVKNHHEGYDADGNFMTTELL